MRGLLLIGLFFLAGLRLGAQDYKRQYQAARQHFDEGFYSLAFEGFKTLLVYDKNNPYHIHANFFYALTAYHLGYRTVAKETLKQITTLYPDWISREEVWLWQAKLAFEDGEVFRALALLRNATDEGVRNHAGRMVRYWLARVEDAEVLRMLLEENRDNRLVAEAVVHRYLSDFLPAHQAYIDSVAIAHGLDSAQFRGPLPAAVKKDRYVVSLLFPFLASTLQPTTQPKPNQAVLQLYHGIRLAADSLARRGVAIELRAYDTERNPARLQALLQLPELLNSDLLVGPLFPDEVPVVRHFSAMHRIAMVNPVTHNSEFAAGNPYALLFQPSHETIGKKAAAWLAAHVKNRHALVFYGESVRDSVLAFSFIREALKAGINIRLAQEVRRETAQQLVGMLATPTEFDEFKNPVQFTLKRDSIGSIFVASDDPLIYSKVVNSVQTRNDSTLVLGGESWIASESNAVSLENFERLGMVLWAPNHASMHSRAYLSFVRQYFKKHGAFPSLHARAGYEFMLVFGDILHRHGTHFLEGLRQAGVFAGPFDKDMEWGEARDNQQVPLIRVRNGMIMPAGSRENR